MPCNNLSESSKEDNIHVVQQDNLQYLYFSGGINLSYPGIRSMAKCYSQNQANPNIKRYSYVSNSRDGHKQRQYWNNSVNQQDIYRSVDNEFQYDRL